MHASAHNELVAWATTQRDTANRTALNVKSDVEKFEEAIQFWLGYRDAFNALILHLKANPLTEPSDAA